jgi:hypothetical protein
MSVTLNGTSGLVFGDGTIQGTAAGMPFRNRIINGDMRIDQRNNGTAVTIPLNGTFTVDRWGGYHSQASKFTVQRNAGAIAPPPGFTHYLGATSLSAYSTGTAEQFQITQGIEGNNISDLMWGTSSAKTVTLSFWVRSSLTGTFAVSLVNQNTRSYPATYTINAANTWEYKTITVPGDTSGTWQTTNAFALAVRFVLGYGSTLTGTANAWNAGNVLAPAGAVNVVSTNGATFYVTGVQLENATAATEFERRPITVEQQLCMRYFVSSYTTGGLLGRQYASTMAGNIVRLPIPVLSVPMRALPTVTWFHTGTGTPGQLRQFSSAATISINTSYPDSELGGGYVQLNTDASSNPVPMTGSFDAEI